LEIDKIIAIIKGFTFWSTLYRCNKSQTLHHSNAACIGLPPASASSHLFNLHWLRSEH